MPNASKPNPGALLRRGIGITLLAVGTGCAAHAPRSQYQLANSGRPVKNPQGVCVQIGITPEGDTPSCYQLAQPDQKHHVEPLPLDEFGYLFPPLKPIPKLAENGPAAHTTEPTQAPAIPVTAAPIAPAPMQPSAAPAASIATSSPAPAKTVPAATATSYSEKTLHFATRLPFRLNSAHLSRKNRAGLLAFVNSLEKYHGVTSIRITGHTDRSGPAHFNKWLSEMRAKSAQLWLLSLGIDPRTTHMRGVGSSKPRPHARRAADNRYVDMEVVVRAIAH